jgi:hypothetical protein
MKGVSIAPFSRVLRCMPCFAPWRALSTLLRSDENHARLCAHAVLSCEATAGQSLTSRGMSLSLGMDGLALSSRGDRYD